MKEMSYDKKILYAVSLSVLAILLSILFIPTDYLRITAAAILTAAAVAVYLLIKKRITYSLNKRQVTMLLAVIAALYLTLYYMSGISLGFIVARASFNASIFLKNLLPSAIIIIATEIIRTVLLSQEEKPITVLSYIIAVISDLLLGGGIGQIFSINRLMSVVGSTLFTAVSSNLLYNYISKRYGYLPIIVYRLILTVPFYFIPYSPNLSDAIYAFCNMLLPVAAYLFIALLYEKRQKQATKRIGKWSYIGTGAVLAVMISVVMLISCHFRFGLIVIATPSMSGEINIGDAVVYEQYDDQSIEIGDVIIFTKDGGNEKIVHRVVDIENINGQHRYYTKGDANEDPDFGYITEGDIFGVVKLKVAYIGYPSLWLRSIFE